MSPERSVTYVSERTSLTYRNNSGLPFGPLLAYCYRQGGPGQRSTCGVAFAGLRPSSVRDGGGLPVAESGVWQAAAGTV
jgi:hypothetical protein